jgi:hypothetical protein
MVNGARVTRQLTPFGLSCCENFKILRINGLRTKTKRDVLKQNEIYFDRIYEDRLYVRPKRLELRSVSKRNQTLGNLRDGLVSAVDSLSESLLQGVRRGAHKLGV